ncbi:MFS transporter [Pseudalkalibacillus decolorationis]|uniref:MFS transporter n=1 Tax=Pseudalkalibacillus decolorationis TaxID=163879 RepID=UPI0021482750|nr:MFS transporter [Pseudalkalibacillus decolorationis]
MFIRIQDLRSNKKFLVFLLFIGWTLSYHDRYIINFAVPFIEEEFKFDAATQGMILSSFFAGYALMQIPAGWLADKYGIRNTLLVSIFMFSLFTAFTGMAWSVASLIAIRFIFGMGESGLAIGGVKANAIYFAKKKRARVMSILITAQALSLALAPIIAAPLILWIGWRSMFILLGFLGFLMIIIYWLFIPSSDEKTKSEKDNPKVPLKELLLNPILLKIFVLNFCINILLWGFLSWLPSYMLNVQNLDVLDAGILSSLPGFAGVVGVLLSGWLADKFFNNREKLLVILGILVAIISLFLMIFTQSLVLIVISQITLILSIKFAWLAMWAMPLKMLDSNVMGSASGMINLGSQLAGIVSPITMGFLISGFNGSYNAAFVFLIVVAIISGVISTTVNSGKSLKPKNTVESL